MASILNWLMLFCCIASYSLIAKDLGISGNYFPIQEEDLLHYMVQRIQALSQEEVIAIQSKVKQSLVRSYNEPSITSLPSETHKRRIAYFDPTICIQQDIQDHEGNIIARKGTRINPLEQFSLMQELLFFDATQEQQIAWAKSQSPTAKWILVKGNPLELEEKLNRPVFFDQFGTLTKKLDICHVPAKVSQEGLKLKIEEIPIKEALCIGS